jgi:methionyl-tRNA synthetase
VGSLGRISSSARGNNELVATHSLRSVHAWGNLANRMLSFAYKRFDGKVPEPAELDDEDRALLAKSEAGFQTVGDLYAACKFRAALGEAIGLAREANGYTFATLSACLDRKAPLVQIKEDRQAAATSVYVILRAVDNLKTILAPVLPHTAQPLACGASTWATTGRLRWPCTGHAAGGRVPGGDAIPPGPAYSGAVGTWAASELPPGQALREPAPLFTKLDESVVEEEYVRLAG